MMRLRIHSQETIASVVAAGGIVWAVKIASGSLGQMAVVSLPVGPLELCSAGVAMWLHAKWRRSIRLH
jgi:hypothetical protein